jgi:bromodomain adjacent to zinc finger domain protein 1A
MPLLHKQKFIRKQIPNDINPELEIFFCKLTHEIFLDYE